jgi:hypothetical protein
MAEVGEAEGDSFDSLEEIVGCFGWSVGVMSFVPGGDLMTPAGEGPAQGVDFDWVVGVLEVGAEAGDELEGRLGGRCGRRWI